ncbi:bromodomain-containing protein DDB_G0280777-like [Ochlerotatus camptorhynchus]|uniref:bromodomain-containing protein DDB_G0280777-like n=1 Tax=Ochlerotatus camptorhynchus TaxID=644619 RepID=UPI0031D6BA59
MKWIIVISVLVSLVALQTSAATREKKPEKRPTKKASSVKPTKTPKSIVEEFNGLPPEDIDFIKELDKQFNELGNKIKIKVQRDNSSETKSTKRTIDGDLGYGHYRNQHEGGYHFSKPKYMLYPYAQHHSGHLKATHSTEETVTEVEITPSHSYELKPIEEVYQVYPDGRYHQSTREQQYYEQQQHHHHQQEQEDDTPTIVLKIPGPAKYAQHLKALLQQYLEVRAAQLYKEIQEQEYQHQQHAIAQQQQQLIQQQQQHEHHQQQHQQHYHQHHHGHQHQAQHAQPTKYSQPDPYQTQEVYVQMYNAGHGKFIPVHGHYYESPKSRPTQPAYRKPVATPTHVAYHSTSEPEHEQQAYEYETYHQSQAVAQHQHQHQHQPQVQVQYQYVHQQAPTAPEEQQEEYVYQKPMVNFVTPTPDHDDHQEHYQQPPKYQNFAQYHAQHKPLHQEPEDYLPEPKLVENYPSDKHTRVVYKSQSIKAQLQQASEEQPEYATHHQQDHHQEHDQHEHDHQEQYIYQAVYPSQTPYLENKAFIEPVTPEAINDLHSHGSSPEPEIESPYETEPIVAITQKPKHIYNYHANTPRSNSGHRMHATRSAGSGSSSGSSSSSGKAKSGSSSSSSLTSKASSKRDAPYTEEQFKKINKMVHRMKKKQTPSGAPTTTRSVTSTNKSQ